jgi:hypothetical protein
MLRLLLSGALALHDVESCSVRLGSLEATIHKYFSRCGIGCRERIILWSHQMVEDIVYIVIVALD